MKIMTLIGGAAALLVLGGLAWLAVTDIPVQTTSVTKTIPNERFYNVDSN